MRTTSTETVVLILVSLRTIDRSLQHQESISNRGRSALWSGHPTLHMATRAEIIGHTKRRRETM
jgi:hypothetical protein